MRDPEAPPPNWKQRLRGAFESGVIRGLGKIEDAALRRDRPDETLAHPHARDVHGFLAQPVGGEQLKEIVAEQVDRADIAAHGFGDQVHHAVELRLRRPALGHHIVQAGQYLACRSC